MIPASLLAEATGLSRYDALVDRYELGMTSAVIEPMFAELKRWIPPLIQEVIAKQRTEVVELPVRPFPVAAQRALGVEIMALLGFDFDAGRLDVSTHPLCGGVAEHVGLTTRHREDDFVQALMGIVHETGHARYEQRLPRAWVHLPLGAARSMGIHESQSLAFEMQLGRSRPFLELVSPLVRTGLIRTEADELTYPMHVILRFEIEGALVEEEIEPEDVPTLWDAKMRADLGADTRGNYTDGCLQAIHCTDGALGYVPSYTLGAMSAAQYVAARRTQIPDLDARIAAGDLAPMFTWLDDHIWSQASRWETPERSRRSRFTNEVHGDHRLRVVPRCCDLGPRHAVRAGPEVDDQAAVAVSVAVAERERATARHGRREVACGSDLLEPQVHDRELARRQLELSELARVVDVRGAGDLGEQDVELGGVVAVMLVPPCAWRGDQRERAVVEAVCVELTGLALELERVAAARSDVDRGELFSLGQPAHDLCGMSGELRLRGRGFRGHPVGRVRGIEHRDRERGVQRSDGSDGLRAHGGESNGSSPGEHRRAVRRTIVA